MEGNDRAADVKVMEGGGWRLEAQRHWQQEEGASAPRSPFQMRSFDWLVKTCAILPLDWLSRQMMPRRER